MINIIKEVYVFVATDVPKLQFFFTYLPTLEDMNYMINNNSFVTTLNCILHVRSNKAIF